MESLQTDTDISRLYPDSMKSLQQINDCLNKFEAIPNPFEEIAAPPPGLSKSPPEIKLLPNPVQKTNKLLGELVGIFMEMKLEQHEAQAEAKKASATSLKYARWSLALIIATAVIALFSLVVDLLSL